MATKKKAAKKAPKKKAAKKAKAPEMEMLLVGSKVKAALREQEVNVGAGTLEALNSMIHWYIGQAALRTAANHRKTVQPHDVVIYPK